MVRELVLLPLRVGVRATRVWLRVAEDTATVAANATGRLIGLAASRGSDGRGSDARPRQESERNYRPAGGESATNTPGAVSRDNTSGAVSTLEVSDEAPAHPDRSVAPPPPAAPLGARHVPAARPAHIVEEPELVEELAEPGAEEGAGAEIHVEEPWQGYAQMNAKQVIAQLGTATPAALAAVQLYESRHRRRQTILNAVQRELRSPNGSSSRDQ